MDYNQEYIDLLKRSLAGETETVRLYLAVMAVAPQSAIQNSQGRGKSRPGCRKSGEPLFRESCGVLRARFCPCGGRAKLTLARREEFFATHMSRRKTDFQFFRA